VIRSLVAGMILASTPCEDVGDRQQQIASAAASDNDLRVAIDVLEGELHAPLLTPTERALPRAEQAHLASTRLAGACELARARPSQAGVDRDRLLSILERPELQHARDRQDLGTELWRRFWEWVNALVALRATQQFSVATRRLVLALGLAVAIGAALRLIRRRRPSARAAATPLGAPVLELDDPAVHLTAARSALGSDRREAIRQALLGLLSALERRRWAHPDRVKTNRELADELSRRGAPPDVARRAEKLFSWFDAAFYSQREVPLDEASGFVADVTALVAGAA
jgi:hypothetical protein